MTDLSEKIILITGGTSGIGKAAAAALAGMGAQVVITGRNPEKTQASVEQIRKLSGNPHCDFLLADFVDLEQVRALGRAFKERFPRLDVLINNAGTYYNRRRLNQNGVEYTFLVNHLAPFVLTNELLDTLIASRPARVINISSGYHKSATMDFEDLSFGKGYFGLKAYARSKLANILFSYELARRLHDSGVTVNAVNPGLVTTDIWRSNFFLIGPLIKWVIGRRGLTPEQGADTMVYLASSPEVEGVSGRYFKLRKPVPSSPLSNDKQAARRLWEASEQLTGRKQAAPRSGA